MNSENKTHFFYLGSAFAEFRCSTNPDIPYSADPDILYQRMCDITSSLKLEIPDCDELKNRHEAPTIWFAGSIFGSLKNYYRIGNLSFRLFVISKINSRIGSIPLDDRVIRNLKYYFSSEDIPVEILDDYLTHLKANTSEAFMSFEREFCQTLENKDNESIFGNLSRDPDQFDKEILRGFHTTIGESRECYKNDCNIATIVLCGRVLETLVGSAYQVVFETNPLSAPDIGFSTMLTQLGNQSGIRLPTVNELLKLIYAYRSRVVHANIELPSKALAKCVADLTEEAINRVFGYFADWDGATAQKPLSQVERDSRGFLRDWKPGFTHAWIISTNSGEEILMDEKEYQIFFDSLGEEQKNLRQGLPVAYNSYSEEGNNFRVCARDVIIVES